MNQEIKENVVLVVERVKRGRPKKTTIDLEKTDIKPKQRGRPSKEYEVKERVPLGRPRTVDIIDKTAYHKQYYQNNKEKYKIEGDFECPYCNRISSLANKLRHMKKYHPEII